MDRLGNRRCLEVVLGEHEHAFYQCGSYRFAANAAVENERCCGRRSVAYGHQNRRVKQRQLTVHPHREFEPVDQLAISIAMRVKRDE